MIQLEIILRFLLALLLGWIVLCRPGGRSEWLKIGLVLSAAACGFGMTDALLGGTGAVFSAVFLLSSVLALVGLSPGSRNKPDDAAPVIRLLSSAAACFLAGRGMLLISLLVALVHVVANFFFMKRGAGETGPDPGSGETSFLIRVQDLRGIIGKVEGVLERFQVQKKEVVIRQDREAKELQIRMDVFLAGETEREKVRTAIQEIEGVIQLAVR
jgi:hypothetical protein